MQITVRPSRWFVAASLLVGLSPAVAIEGLRPLHDDSAWSAFSGRVALGTEWAQRHPLTSFDAEPPRISSFSLMGDYYLSRPSLGAAGGWRATSGLLFGAPRSLWSSPALMDRRSAPGVGGDAMPDDASTLPYLGVGYTGWFGNGGWGLSADLGLMAQPRTGPRLGRPGLNASDDWRELRFAPQLQLGLSYSF